MQSAVNFLLVLLLAGFCAAKTVFQGKIGKDVLSTSAAVLLFNSGYFLVAALCMAVDHFVDGSTISRETVFYGALFGVVSVLFQFASTCAMRYGPVSLTVLIVNLSCAIPIIVGIAVWKETPSPWFFPGLALMLAALIFSSDLHDLHIPQPKRWFLFVALAFCCSGVLNIIQKLHQFTPAAKERSAFVMVAYALSTMVALGASAVLAKQYRFPRHMWKLNLLLPTAVVGVILCLYQKLCLVMASRMGGSVLYPMLNGMTLVACTLVGVLLFKDPFRHRQKLCVLCGIGAVVLLSI